MSDNKLKWLKSSVNKGITAINVKTTGLVEKAKLKTHIDTIIADNQEKKNNIGEQVFKLWHEGVLQLPVLEHELQSIVKGYEQVANLEKQIEEIDQRNNEILGKSEVAALEPLQTNQLFVCSNCQAAYEISIKFCGQCGKSMQ